MKFWAFMLVSIFVASVMSAFIMGVYYDDTPDAETYQAALYISNWTNRTLDIDAYVFASDTVLYSVTLDHGQNVTLTVTWQDVKETIAVLHCVGTDVDAWCPYTLEPGEWESVILW